MSKLDYVKEHKNICDELNQLVEKKNKGYGNSIHDTYVEEGMASFRVRLTDKLNRFKNLTKNGNFRHDELYNESVRDTLMDLANYAILTIVELDNDENCKFIVK